MLRELAQNDISYSDLTDLKYFQNNILPLILEAKKLDTNVDKYSQEFIVQELLLFQNMPKIINPSDIKYIKINNFIISVDESHNRKDEPNLLQNISKFEEEDLLDYYHSQGILDLKTQSLKEFEQPELDREKYEYLQEVELKDFKTPHTQIEEDKGGIQAFCFQNIETKGVDFIYRGTARIKDILVDVKMGLAYDKPKYFDEAVEFAYKNTAALNKYDDIHFLGHSLGGALATYVHHMMQDVNSKTTTFNAFNVTSLILDYGLIQSHEKIVDTTNFSFQSVKGTKEFLSELNEAMDDSPMKNVIIYNFKKDFDVLKGHTLGEVYHSAIIYDEITEYFKNDNLYNLTEIEFIENINQTIEKNPKAILRLLIKYKIIGKINNDFEDKLNSMDFEELYKEITGENIEYSYDDKTSSKMKRLSRAAITKAIRYTLFGISKTKNVLISLNQIL